MTRWHKESVTAMVTVLGGICLVAAALLAWVHEATAGPVEAARQRAKVEAVAEVLPPFDNDPVAEAVTVYVDGDADALSLYPATLGGSPSGAAVSSWSMEGFSGRIDIIFGFDIAGNVTGYRVLSHSETPGLGAKMTEWFTSGNPGDIIGTHPSGDPPKVRKDGGTVDGITAATITSRAFLDALTRAAAAFDKYNQ